jgi:hypothetical protein
MYTVFERKKARFLREKIMNLGESCMEHYNKLFIDTGFNLLRIFIIIIMIVLPTLNYHKFD